MKHTVERVGLVALNVSVEAVAGHAKLKHIAVFGLCENLDSFAEIKRGLLPANTKKGNAVFQIARKAAEGEPNPAPSSIHQLLTLEPRKK